MQLIFDSPTSQYMDKIVFFRHVLKNFTHRCLSHCSRYVLPAFSERWEKFRSRTSAAIYRNISVRHCLHTNGTLHIIWQHSVQYIWLDFCTIWDKVISNWCYLTVQTAMCVLYRRKLNFTQLYWTGREQLQFCAYWRVLLKCSLKCSLCGSVDCTGLDQDWVSNFVEQFLDLSKGKLASAVERVLKDRSVVPPAYVQLSTLTAHRCAHTHTHTHKHFKRCVRMP